MRIFILEDNIERIEWFKRIYKNHELYITCKLEWAKEDCKKYEFDVLFLDHDISQLNLEAIETGNTGYDFVKWLVENKLQRRAIVYIHSMNPTGANAMQNLLKDNRYEVLWIPFHLLKLEDRNG